MEVILLERIESLGQMGEVVKVKDGFARNFLLPQRKALRATAENKARFERDRETLIRLNAERKAEAQGGAGRLDGTSYVLLRQASETLQLYGSVSARDIAEVVSAGGAAITRQQVRLDSPIKALGLHDVRIALHPEVVVTVKINVARSAEEAEIQARGGVIQPAGATEAEAEAEAAAEVEMPSAGEAASEGEAAPA
jgi:large subunit ribosomal protein L9